MKIKSIISSFLLLPVLVPAGCGLVESEPEIIGQTVITVGLPQTDMKTAIGDSQNGKRKVYWADGDCISLSGTASAPLSGIGASQSSATFTVEGEHSLPYDILYPASYYKDAATVTLPSAQGWASGTPVPFVTPMACRMTSEGGTAILNHLCAIVRISVLLDSSLPSATLAAAAFAGNSNEPLSGDFTIDYSAATLSPKSGNGLTLVSQPAQALSASVPVDVYFAVPAGEFPSGFTVTLKDSDGGIMKLERKKGVTLNAGSLVLPAAVSFKPSSDGGSAELELGDLEEENLIVGSYNVTGRVVDDSGNPIAGVVVSDGQTCVRSMSNGEFFLQSSDDHDAHFIFISTPSGYLPPVENGVPKFYKSVNNLSRSGGVLQCGDFVLTPFQDPDNCTIIVTADPQPRASNLSLDNAAYRSLDCCKDLYRELRDVAQEAKSAGRQVYGVCLGDVVHENMSLFSNYVDDGLSTLGYPTFNVIGNHDHDPSAADDIAGAAPFESWFGPVNYSFNVGKMHFVVLDNIIMYKSGSKLSSYSNGLDKTTWEWLRADLAMVPKSTVINVCAHGPMFRKDTGAEISSREATVHGEEYATLLRSFKTVHAWAGHTHATFNYVYPNSHANRSIQVHTLARSTGDFWTNEYLSCGTPKGFTIVEVRGGVISSWRFHPTKYLNAAFRGSKQPNFVYRPWTYSGGVAQWNGKPLDESYQMHVYPPGTYGDSYLYVNVFLWDTKWEVPMFVRGGSATEMEQVTDADRYDAADTEMRQFYRANSSIIKALGDDYPESQVGNIHTLFRVSAPSSGTGTVMVTDRFGNEYRQTISW
ncbi:MAG: calcineurin-like phosphoesterase C-terminal domain-containing protein [Bacteroidales bacterium]|nr:calcineurin-like phosphoesterase C-terminal domain-containing protein [Bacteroidales bacterium]